VVVDASGLSRILSRMTNTQKALTRGARARFFRDGHELVSACDIPVAGAFAVRDLAPGQYVVRDSCDGEQAFTVTVNEELTVILSGDTVGPSGGPGLSGSAEVSALRVGPGGGVYGSVDQVAAGESVTDRVRVVPGEAPAEGELVVPKAERPSDRPEDPGSDERVPGQAGAPFVLEEASVAERVGTLPPWLDADEAQRPK
jgi:hypothetical protein